jgi:hypothetical protein
MAAMTAAPAITGLAFLTKSMLGGVSFPCQQVQKRECIGSGCRQRAKLKVLKDEADKRGEDA